MSARNSQNLRRILTVSNPITYPNFMPISLFQTSWWWQETFTIATLLLIILFQVILQAAVPCWH